MSRCLPPLILGFESVLGCFRAGARLAMTRVLAPYLPRKGLGVGERDHSRFTAE
ncbi:MAG TPA: hypothetical protein VE944_31205 [Nostoc sp.]|uniref:hypothetical protein n=1 Tax=Nostoc sp. TaxID=1180 RepID=UPI002D745322|nr:hypothetical protein [Nostoc sp.]HYX18759.1 hypothetical protein [Nostoc sp.]